MSPSVDDFNSCYCHGYKSGVIACHNGKIFCYSSEQFLNSKLYELNIGDYLSDGLSEYEAQIRTLADLKHNHKINFEEVI